MKTVGWLGLLLSYPTQPDLPLIGLGCAKFGSRVI